LELNCDCDRMRHDFAPEAMMSTFHRADHRRTRPGLPSEIEGRLPPAPAALVIAGLSALSWAVLIAIVVVVHAVL
jgi:hypothetical protein